MSAARQANHMRLQAALAAGKVGRPKQGLVTSYDPDGYAVKVMLQPEQIETGWLPIETAMAGAGWGLYAGPQNGDMACVVFLEGDREVGWCTGFLPNDQDKPPHVAAGEIQAIHKDGASLKFIAGGVVNLVAPGGFNVTGDTLVTGKLHVTDDVTADKTVTATTDVVGGGKHLKTHVHSGVQSGGSNTGAPV